MIKLTCTHCGVTFEGRNKPDAGLRFCSRKCVGLARRKDGIIGKKQYHGLTFLSVQCDNCEVQFQRYCSKVVAGQLQFCSVGCQRASNRKGGKLLKKARATLMKNHGVTTTLNMPETRKKAQDTLIARFGSKCALADPGVTEKSRQTCVDRYGVENVMQDPEIFNKAQRSRTKRTLLTHWKTGVDVVCTASYEVAFVNWCSSNKIDFEWQIPIKTTLLTPTGKLSVYFVDAYVKDGEFAGTWIEIKGHMKPRARAKWEWFHAEYVNSQLWDAQKLRSIGILC
jgi:hypothetical protein